MSLTLFVSACVYSDPKQDLMTDEWAAEVVARSEAAAKKDPKPSREEEALSLLHGPDSPFDGVSIIPPAASYATPSLPHAAGQAQQPTSRPVPAPTSAGLNGTVLSDSEEEMLGPSIRKHLAPTKPTAPAPVDSDTEEEMLGPPRRSVASTSTQEAQAVADDDSDEEMLSFARSKSAGPSLRCAANIVNPRPDFLTTPEQGRTGPLVLDAAKAIEVPPSINCFLREYQRQGVRFLYAAYRDGRGAILGDDMGLGKTVQVAAFLAAIMRKDGGSRDERRRANDILAKRLEKGDRADKLWPTALILVPASLLDNWARELNTWGYFEFDVFSSDTRRNNPLRRFERGFLDIILCTHDYAVGHIDELKSLAWSCIFADEAHNFKNPNASVTQAVNLFECKRRFAISGTVISNRSEEMWTILDWTNPGTFANLSTWKHLVAMPLKLGQRSNATEEELETSRFIARCLTRDVLPRYMIRRTKALVATDLPPKLEKIVFCPLAEAQIDAYRRLLNDKEVVAMRGADLPCECGERDDEGKRFKYKNCCGQKVLSPLLSTIFLLMSLANHAALFFPSKEEEDSAKPETAQHYLKQVEYCKRLFPRDWRNKRYDNNSGLDERLCGKWQALRSLLEIWNKAGDKVLIFSRSLRLLNWIQAWVRQEGYKELRLDGSTAAGSRQTLVEEFNRDPSVFCFLISTLAGGVGLNLTGANKVVVFDPSWSPADDSQAIDRAYRIGQTRTVTVYRLIGAGTIEEIVYGRQVYKTQAANVNYGNRLAAGGAVDADDLGAHDDDVYSTPKAPRLFEGVDGAGQHTGELFGIVNMLTFHEHGLMQKLADREQRFAVADADPNAAGNGEEIEGIARAMGDKMQLEGDDIRRALVVTADEQAVNGGSQEGGASGEVRKRASGSASGSGTAKGRGRRSGASASASPENDRETAGLRNVGTCVHDHAGYFDASSDGDDEGTGRRTTSGSAAKKRKTATTTAKRATAPRKPSQPQPQQPAAAWPPPRKPSGQQPQANGAAASTSAQA